MIDGVQIPEGVDPSFLEALPEAIRREVIAEQLALRRTPAPSSGPSTSSGGENSGTLNVSPEFLAALPPEVQDEVSLVFKMIFVLVYNAAYNSILLELKISSLNARLKQCYPRRWLY